MKLTLKISDIDSEMVELKTVSRGKAILWAVVHIDFIHGDIIHEILKETTEAELYMTHHNPDKMMLRPEG